MNVRLSGSWCQPRRRRPHRKMTTVSDPIHDAEAGPGIAWSTGNMAEAMPGVATPLNWSFFRLWDDAIHEAFREAGVYTAAEIAVRRTADQRFVGIFYGR